MSNRCLPEASSGSDSSGGAPHQPRNQRAVRRVQPSSSSRLRHCSKTALQPRIRKLSPPRLPLSATESFQCERHRLRNHHAQACNGGFLQHGLWRAGRREGRLRTFWLKPPRNSASTKSIDDFELPLYTSLMPDPEEMTEWETAWAALRPARRPARKPGRPAGNRYADGHGGFRHRQRRRARNPVFRRGVYTWGSERSFTASAKAYGTRYEQADRRLDHRYDDRSRGKRHRLRKASINGVEVAGKTGIAETNKEQTAGSWASRPDNLSVVVAVVQSRKVSLATTRLDWQVPAPKSA